MGNCRHNHRGRSRNQQGIRFCIFHLIQTYHGIDPGYGISAKGLTGESYCGWTWWDTETYCLPFYMFTNVQAAKNLLLYRYNTLPQAIERAAQLDCTGARYPMATINGTEAVGTWQHGDLEIHVSVAVAYGIWHYVNITGDKEFLYNQGIEMLLQISRYYASRGQWAQKTGDFGFWGVMGPDEFAMMVHNNYYTNAMVKKAFEYCLSVVDDMKVNAPAQLALVERKVALANIEYADWLLKADKMRLPQDASTGIYEQYDGYFNMPRVDPKEIPDEQFPLYKSWAYVRIFRNDMIKQPDVLLMHLFYSHDYTLENKRANYQFYEARCCHESSLSPGIHAILASELGMHQQAFEYVRFASRLDLDNYNNNTHEGIHNTSMAAAWMNIVYGFAGLRTDGDLLSFKPSIPAQWTGYSFKLKYKENLVNFKVDHKHMHIKLLSGSRLVLMVFDKQVEATQKETSVGLNVEQH
ncbi:MAG: hypothetical protein HC896_02410 [Bacteroidales bacterium]|nr:hypothetical protein [Bacteroidales bacterium]